MKTHHVQLACLRALFLISLLFLVCPTWAADGNPPDRMTYQGFLADGNGDPLGSTNTGPKNYDVIFRVFTEQTGGTQLWAEQQTLTVDKGYFSVLLGEGSAPSGESHPAFYTLFTNTANASDRYIEITVKGIGASNGDVTIAPRLRLLTSPYAFLARNAVNAGSLVNSANTQILTISGTNVTINGAATAARWSGNGAGLTNLDASQLTMGTIADARLSANLAKLNTNQTFSGTNTFSANMYFGSSTRQMLNLFSTNYAIGIQSHTLYQRSDYDFAWYTDGQHSDTAKDPGVGGTLLMLLDNSGRLGIGSSSPDRPLTVKASGAQAAQWISLMNSSNATKWHLNHLHGGLNFAETGLADGRLFLQTNGNVGIGTTNPVRLLQVGSDLIPNSQGMIRLGSRSGTTSAFRTWDIGVPETEGDVNGVGYSFVIDDILLGTNAEFMVKWGTGNVGIHTDAPAYTLHVNGTMGVESLPQGDRRNVQWDPNTHQFYQSVSSRRYKENIAPLVDDFQRLLSAEPKTYTMRGDPDHRHIGYIAEDIHDLGLQWLVDYNAEGQPDALHYEKMVLYLVEIAKAQKTQIEHLNQQLEQKSQALEQEVAELKAMVKALAKPVNREPQ